MQVVIDIDDEYYSYLRRVVFTTRIFYRPVAIIAKGKPLPKGHGRLIDTNEITAFMELECNGHNVESLDEFTVIIEADGGDAE